MKILLKIIVSALILVGSLNLRADANPDLWPYIHERMFQDTEIVEADFIKIDGPKRAASGAQVPVNIKLQQQQRGFIYKKFTLLLMLIQHNTRQLTTSQIKLRI